MSEAAFTIRFVTPLAEVERQAVSLRLKDASGHFGILKDHADFMTVLVPSLDFYRTPDGSTVFLAVRGGLVLVRQSTVTVLSREIRESKDAEKLGSLLGEEKVKEDSYEMRFREMVSGVEKAFWKKRIESKRAEGG